MNIFWLSRDPDEAARFYCDDHLRKIPIECNQMITTALSRYGYQNSGLHGGDGYRHHPVTRWVMASRENLLMTIRHARALDRENRRRQSPEDPESYPRHRSVAILDAIPSYVLERVPSRGLSDPPVVPSDYLGEDFVERYRKYYRDKAREGWMTWKERGRPDWL